MINKFADMVKAMKIYSSVLFSPCPSDHFDNMMEAAVCSPE